MVDEFVARAAGDVRINKFFAATAADPARLKRFKMHLVDQIGMASGGPCTYQGKDMKTAHMGMGVTGATSPRSSKTWAAPWTSSASASTKKINSSAPSRR